MVAPSCCLEYRPTATFWAIVIFGVFPAIYCVGRVFQFLCVLLFRAIAAIIRFLLFEDDEKEVVVKEELTVESVSVDARKLDRLQRELARYRRREKEAKEREMRRQEQLLAQAKLLTEAEHEAERTTQLTKLLANGAPRIGHVTNGHVPNGDVREEAPKRSPDQSHSDSPISECEDETSQATTHGTAITELDHPPHRPVQTTLRHRFPAKKIV